MADTTYTNTTALPDVFEAAMRNDPYSAGPTADITVTQLPAPPLLRALAHVHGERRDVSDSLWSLLGSALHKVLERAGTPGVLTEGRWEALAPHFWTLGGGYDAYDPATRTLTDYKCVGYYKFREGVPKEYVAQLNCLAWLAARQTPPIPVKALRIIAVYRDWSAGDAARERAKLANAPQGTPSLYPSAPILAWDVERWTDDQTTAYIEERIKLHQHAQQAADFGDWDAIPVCTPAERWYKPKGREPARYTRCMSWCPTRHVCPHAQDVAPDKAQE